MMLRVFAVIFGLLPALPLFLNSAYAAPAGQAAADRAAFLQSVKGQWSGSGQVVAGRYKGVKFTCKFTAPDAGNAADIKLDGSCRAGIFSQPIKASISPKSGTYQGSFNDGARGNGMDITAGTVDKNGMVLQLNREKLQGNMTARLQSGNQMHITLAVVLEGESIPVIGMDLARVNAGDSETAAAKSGSMFAWLGE